MSQILVTGIITLDIIHYLSHYPDEDSKQRTNQPFFKTGGNASTSGYILKQLGHEPKFAATLADDTAATFICQQIKQKSLQKILQDACKLAGQKGGHTGLNLPPPRNTEI